MVGNQGKSLRRDLRRGLSDASPAMQRSGDGYTGGGASWDQGHREEQASMTGPRGVEGGDS